MSFVTGAKVRVTEEGLELLSQTDPASVQEARSEIGTVADIEIEPDGTRMVEVFFPRFHITMADHHLEPA